MVNINLVLEWAQAQVQVQVQDQELLDIEITHPQADKEQQELAHHMELDHHMELLAMDQLALAHQEPEELAIQVADQELDKVLDIQVESKAHQDTLPEAVQAMDKVDHHHHTQETTEPLELQDQHLELDTTTKNENDL